ncbi:ribbon-helix-helix domain-containing protein [Candidatus Daviesbacteria bacterium]|nr:ribbon-helix-helix domain-containing protein [Candidatus Daviesbacteria bacterium]
MKVYFTGSIKGKYKYIDNYLKIIEIIKDKKFSIISDHIIKTTEDQISLETKEGRLRFNKKLESWISSCDFMIAETSFPSISVGYEISLAIRLGKPVLILFSEGHAPSLFAHFKNEKLVCEKYSLETLKDIIDDFINYVQGTEETRFTFFITPEIALHLEEISKKEKLPKSVYLRKLIEKDIKVRNK